MKRTATNRKQVGFKVGDIVKSRWVHNVEPGTVGWVSRSGEYFTFADAPDESCNIRDYLKVSRCRD